MALWVLSDLLVRPVQQGLRVLRAKLALWVLSALRERPAQQG